MKKLLIILMLCLFVTSVHADIIGEIGDYYNHNVDKVAHGFMGATTTAVAMKHGVDPIGSVIFAGIAGTLKEWADENMGGVRDDADVVATIVGGIAYLIL